MAGKKTVTYEITERIVTLKEAGYRTKELNKVSFNGAEPKYDIRIWMRFPEGLKMGKGITLTAEEMRLLRDAVNAMGGL